MLFASGHHIALAMQVVDLFNGENTQPAYATPFVALAEVIGSDLSHATHLRIPHGEASWRRPR